MNYWLIADTHFGHDKIHEPDFGERPLGFEEKILKSVKHTVSPDDILIHLGDVSFYNHEEWHARLWAACSGKMWLTEGNHDKKTLGWYYAAGWDVVAEEIKIHIYGTTVLLSHKPIIGRDDFDLNIHGHLHGNTHHDYPVDERHVSLYLEHHYAPVNLRKIVEAKR